MPKANATKGDKPRHNPLADDLVATGPLRTKPSKRKSRHEENKEENYVDSKASKKILKMAQELEEENGVKKPAGTLTEAQSAFSLDPRFLEDEDEDDEEVVYEDEGEWGADEEEVEEIELSAEDLNTFNMFNGQREDALLRDGWDYSKEEVQDERPDTWLADLMLEKIAEKEAQDARNAGNGDRMSEAADDDFELPPKVIEVYSKIGLILSRYKSGKLPKAFKILPSTPHWEEIIQYTRPESWTANACYEATRLFVSSTPATVQKFMEMILLPACTADIYETKHLNVHLMKALKRALYKPQAFFKGFLFPLVSSGNCTLREARCICSALVKVSIPMLHSAAAIKGLCDIAAEEVSVGNEGGGATNIFIKALLDKKYALPYQVIDALVFHFLRFRTVDTKDGGDAMQGVTGAGLTEKQAREAQLPVIWHQCLLSFAQRYRDEITEDQREALLDLLLTKGHAKIGPEVRRELLAGRGRGVPLVEPTIGTDGDDTMMT